MAPHIVAKHPVKEFRLEQDEYLLRGTLRQQDPDLADKLYITLSCKQAVLGSDPICIFWESQKEERRNASLERHRSAEAKLVTVPAGALCYQFSFQN